jgi:hypothetical protein
VCKGEQQQSSRKSLLEKEASPTIPKGGRQQCKDKTDWRQDTCKTRTVYVVAVREQLLKVTLEIWGRATLVPG